MKPRFHSAKSVTAFVVAPLLAVTLFALEAMQACAASKKKYEDRTAVFDYGPNGPNASYQSGPHTRIYITKRSWLDGGTEVLPGDRKFTDYAIPPGYSFGRENNNRPIDRQPLNPPSDMGGYERTFPLY